VAASGDAASGVAASSDAPESDVPAPELLPELLPELPELLPELPPELLPELLPVPASPSAVEPSCPVSIAGVTPLDDDVAEHPLAAVAAAPSRAARADQDQVRGCRNIEISPSRGCGHTNPARRRR
jgi:hypothetical protein